MRHRIGRRTGLPVLARLCAFSLGIWAIGAVMTGDHLMAVRVGLYAAPMLMMAAGALSFLALLYHARVTAVAMCAICVGLFTVQAPSLLRAMVPQHATDQQIEVLSVVSLSNRTLNQDTESTALMVRSEDADLFILQEVADAAKLINAIEDLQGPSWHYCHDDNYLIVSKHPLSSPLPGVWSGMMACEVYLPSGPTWVGSVHLPRGVTTKADQARVMNHLMALFEEMSGPKIIAGDFNATPLASPIRRMETRLQSAFAQAGKGFGFTFPTPARKIGFVGPFLQIDYIFHSQEFKTVQAAVMPNHPPLADHFPIKALLRPIVPE